ncbi:uncharacterized protein LOC117294354 [Asterias rubens]|uniref:uncharacterized protein LOC117294354 n=1 Tax=Asterias rubens TaxID=7604 RepID=UPI0014558693|nr:uncharacterized protein LOC117294354 [Asterias rubens]
MDGRISMFVLLVCIWCSLDAGGLLMVVTAQPTVTPASTTAVIAVILTPEADRKEGGRVDMRCTATNLESDHIVEWRSTEPYITLRWNDTTLTPNIRFMFNTTYPQSGMVVQDFTITNLQIDDYDEYVCNVNYPIPSGGHTIIATSSVILSAPSYPVCSPSGPIAVDTGTELPLRCLSEADNPADIETHPMTDPSYYPWSSSTVDGTNTLSLRFTATVADGGVAFNCYVLCRAFNCSVLQGSDADGRRSCIIGPISLTISEDATNEITSIESETTLTPPSITQPPPSNPWMVALTPPSITQPPPSNPWMVAFVVTHSVSIIVIILGVFQIFKMRRLINSLRKTEASQVPMADPYMELQPTEDKNKVYMEPTTATTTTQDTYYQPVEVETDSPEYDYARPDGSTNTDYEAVNKP